MANGEKSISKAEAQKIKKLVSDIRENNKERQKENIRKLSEGSKKLSEKITPEKTPKEQLDLSKLKNINTGGKSEEISKPARKPVDDSQRMWVVSWWENRKKMDPTFDPDQWFKSSVHLDDKKRLNDIDDFWAGRGQNDTTDFWTSSMWGI